MGPGAEFQGPRGELGRVPWRGSSHEVHMSGHRAQGDPKGSQKGPERETKGSPGVANGRPKGPRRDEKGIKKGSGNEKANARNTCENN